MLIREDVGIDHVVSDQSVFDGWSNLVPEAAGLPQNRCARRSAPTA
jgi:hypothetical protein